MNMKKKARRVMSGLLTAVTVLSTVLSPAVAYASDDAESVKKIPYYEEIKDQLDEDEVVTAKDYEIKVGDNFDVKSDYTGLTIQDDSKVKVTFQEAKDTDGNDFSTDYANSYKAVYYVEPQTTDHPTYQINRKIVVKEADQQKDSQSESSSDQDAGSSDKTETEDSEADSSTEETDAADTESKTELTEKEFDAEIEATEDQETVDPETGITLSEVMQEAVDQEVALADLEAGESITFDMPMMLASGETGTKSVTVTAGSWYYYADYGLGSYLTCPYYVKWGSINATAYCVEPSKKGPGNGTYTIQKLADGKTLAKVCYYGTKASDENGFFDEKHPDFPAGKRFIITHLAAAYANGSSDWASGTNATGKNLAMELYNYCVNMPDIPSVDMSFSESNVKAYVEGNSQRTSVITFKADKLQTITFKLPSGVKLVNVSTGKTSAAGASVEISGGISIDCRELHRRVMTVLTNRLNTETGSMLKHEGGTITQAEKERFGQSKMIRYVSGIDQMIYPIAFIKNKIPMAKRSIVCSYTKEGRAPIHTELNLNQYVLKGLREKISVGHSTEYHDSKISLFSAQKGKCAISGEEFADAEHVAVWLKVPRVLGGFERYKNMVLIHKKYLILLQELPQAVIKDLIKTLNITKKMLVKINSLREQANLSAII